MPGRVFAIFAVLQMVAHFASAHPVAQGAMEISVRSDGVTIHARVANEEAFVAEAFGGKANAASDALEEVWQRHGEYLLAHLHITADGIPLAGEVDGITPPEKPLPQGRVSYDLRFRFPANARKPSHLEFRQDVLNEFVFAPGNPWEASYITRIVQEDGATAEEHLWTSREPLQFACNRNASAARETASQLDRQSMAAAFVRHGIAHILGGYDHLLFVTGLVLAVRSLWDLVKVVSAFTLAHTLTLTLAVLDIVRLPGRIVEPMIAASIVFVAAQNMLAPERSRGWTRLAVAFGFGLFHGLGFAGGLLDAMEGMAGIAVGTAIAAFSIGVELGHQMVALPLFAGLKIARSFFRAAPDPERMPRRMLRLASGAICVAGCVYLVAALR